MLVARELVEQYLRSEAEEIATIAAREVSRAMQPGSNIGFNPELHPIQIENATAHIHAYPAHRQDSEASDAMMKRALHNWGVMYRAHGARTRRSD
ncbi:hypothetical protein K2P56_02305 [Patescibacteria group bacterium]|nr:hypothetical protein [Patescibacteria group bacterium]